MDNYLTKAANELDDKIDSLEGGRLGGRGTLIEGTRGQSPTLVIHEDRCIAPVHADLSIVGEGEVGGVGGIGSVITS